MPHDEYQPTREQISISWEPPEGTEYQLGLPHVGQKLLDRYEIFEAREGGFGVVFFVTDLKTNQNYAVKTYKPEGADRFASAEQFKAEVDFWINLEPHPNIVTAYFVEVIQEQPYLFMQLVNGDDQTSLRDWLRSTHFGASQAVLFAYQLCRGMEFANQKGEIAHCDLKPENILIDQHRVLKVTDFGLAQRVKVNHGIYPRPAAGTWAYAAPEMLEGQAVNSQSDIFSFGVILYEMLTGKLPYPFELSHDSKVQFKQLSDFHRQHGMHKVSGEIYHRGIPDIPSDSDLNILLSMCLDHLERLRDFSMLREQFEYYFKQNPFPLYSKSLRFYEDLYQSVQSSRDDLYQRALSLHKIGRYSDALSVFNKLLLQHPNEGQFWLDAAQTLLAIGNRHTAQRFLYRALDLNPQFREAEQLLASL